MSLKEVKRPEAVEEVCEEKAEAPVQTPPQPKTPEEIRKEIAERIHLQLKSELQNCQNIIANQLAHSQNLALLLELSESELVKLNKPVLQ